jgi:hypothetical protein
MRIGFASIYSWRPHVSMLHYLAELARQAGHETFFLTCDGDLPDCYTREQKKDRPAWLNCALCRAGGARSFERRNVSSIAGLAADAPPASPRSAEWAASSAATLGRFETDEEFAGPDFARVHARLEPAGRAAYAAARKWIAEKRLDALCVFNGRVEATRSLCEAARDAGIRYVTQERTWFGDGIQLFPDENCLGLRAVDAIMAEWRDRPLSREQALRAARHIAARFLRRNDKEWRAYNVNAASATWPAEPGRRRILLLPGSRSESWGHPDCAERWPERAAAFEALKERFGLSYEDFILRCHPVWAETVSGRSGEASERYYTRWAAQTGVRLIPSKGRESTADLIRAADAVVVTGGSAALEAGILGKQVIGTAPSIYQESGFQSNAYDPERLEAIRLMVAMAPDEQARQARRIRRLTLRFCFNNAYRVSQFVPFVEAVTTTQYAYRQGADPQQFIRLLETGTLSPDDSSFAPDEREEDAVLDRIEAGDWERLYQEGMALRPPAGPPMTIARRGPYRLVDRVRDLMPRGDL